MILYVDTETRCDLDLKTVGLYRYAERAEITLLAVAVGNGTVEVDEWHSHSAVQLQLLVNCAENVMLHNAEFDVNMLAVQGVEIPLAKQYCTQAQARRHGLPGGLDKLCSIFNVPQDKAKLKAGHAAMLLFCKPQKDGVWATKYTHPKEWQIYLQYAGLDVEAMRYLHGVMPTWNDEKEMPVWQLDQEINSRGFAVDLDLARKAVDQLAKVKEDLADATTEATGGVLVAATQRDKLLAYILEEYGVSLPNLQAATIERRLKDEDLPDEVRELLGLRQQSVKTSNSKYNALLKIASSDGRLRGAEVYCGAMRTKRWAGKGFHPLNLPRPTLTHQEIEDGIAAIKGGYADLA